MSATEIALYKWIVGANERREGLNLPPGLIETSVDLLLTVLGHDYLEHVLVTGSEPISLFNPDVNPLKMWLKSPIDTHIVQTLEFATYLRIFKDDPALNDKIKKLKHDRFWPVFFELAMAARIKTACKGSQSVALNREDSKSIGDFVLIVDGVKTPCECSRLGHAPQVTEPRVLAEHLSKRIGDATERIPIRLVFTIRSAEPLTGPIYNVTLRLIRKCLADIRRCRLPTVHIDGSTSVCCGEMTKHSERLPFQEVDGVLTNVDGTDWDIAHRLVQVPAANNDEISERFKAGEKFDKFEAVRLFIKFGPPINAPDFYDRLTNRLRKKISQTKVEPGDYGKLILVEVPFALRLADPVKLKAAIFETAKSSKTTLAVVLANRERNPHFRYHYSLFASLNTPAFTSRPELTPLFRNFRFCDINIDLVTGLPYVLSWQEANSRIETLD